MNNEPVAWMLLTDGSCVETTDWYGVMREWEDYLGDNEKIVELYTQEQLEEARKLGMQQERALWNLSELTQKFESFDRTASHMAGKYVAHPVKELTDEEIIELWKQFENNETPIRNFARAILRKAQEK